jgi:hypothetical protein
MKMKSKSALPTAKQFSEERKNEEPIVAPFIHSSIVNNIHNSQYPYTSYACTMEIINQLSRVGSDENQTHTYTLDGSVCLLISQFSAL